MSADQLAERSTLATRLLACASKQHIALEGQDEIPIFNLRRHKDMSTALRVFRVLGFLHWELILGKSYHFWCPVATRPSFSPRTRLCRQKLNWMSGSRDKVDPSKPYISKQPLLFCQDEIPYYSTGKHVLMTIQRSKQKLCHIECQIMPQEHKKSSKCVMKP